MRVFVSLLLCLAIGGSAFAAEKKVSPVKKAAPAKAKTQKLPPPGPFDGFYKGVMKPAPALSKRPCGALAVSEFEINRGRILYIPGIVAFEGSVTSAGFVSGAVHYAGESKAPLQGRIISDASGVHIRAGVIDDAAGCAWTMELKKQSSD